jgi:hypothetical protein
MKVGERPDRICVQKRLSACRCAGPALEKVRPRRPFRKAETNSSRKEQSTAGQTSLLTATSRSRKLHATDVSSNPSLPTIIVYPYAPRKSPSASITAMSILITGRRGSSLQSSALLTPPETPSTPKDTPFKPRDGDTVSLSMKRRHKGQGDDSLRPRRGYLSNDDLRLAPARMSSMPALHRCKSLPSLRDSNTYPISKPTLLIRAVSGTADSRRRRWTLPSKAGSTRCLAHTVSMASVSAYRRKKVAAKETESPAMITLRRATNSQSSRKMSLTFFPEPKFERSRTGFLTAFLSSITSSEDVVAADDPQLYLQDARRSSRSSASVESGKAQPSGSGSAPTVCTEVSGMEPRLSIPGQSSTDPELRRCSTKFITAESIYEVIWDEHANSSTASDSSHSPPEPNSEARRRSVAVEQLQTQLSKAVARSRRESLASQPSRSRRQSLADLFSFKFSRNSNDGRLQNFPRSKSSTNAKLNAPVHPMINVVLEGVSSSSCLIEFFPPLRSRATMGASKCCSKYSVDRTALNPPSTSSVIPPKEPAPCNDSQAGGLGSMVGVSTHMRRGTQAIQDDWFVRSRSNAINAVSRRSSAATYPRTRTVVEDDMMPLLSNMGM